MQRRILLLLQRRTLNRRQKCKEYEKKKEILNKMAEQKCDVYEAKRILGIIRGKTYVAITKEKKGEDNKQNQRKKVETSTTKTEEVEVIVIKTRAQTEKNTKMYPPYREETEKKEHKEQENQTKSKPKQREGKKEETNENKYIKTRNQFDVLGDKTPETREEETQHV